MEVYDPGQIPTVKGTEQKVSLNHAHDSYLELQPLGGLTQYFYAIISLEYYKKKTRLITVFH